MKIYVDGQEMAVSATASNIVEVATENGLEMYAPCFRKKKSRGCCKACIIEVDGVEALACCTEPKDGMQITYLREDLNQRRGQALKAYLEAHKNGCACKSREEAGLQPINTRNVGCGCRK